MDFRINQLTIALAISSNSNSTVWHNPIYVVCTRQLQKSGAWNPK